MPTAPTSRASWDDIFAAVKRVHETLHAEGTVRLSTAMKIGTRTDKEPSLGAKEL